MHFNALYLITSAFVDAFNDVIERIDAYDFYDAETEQRGVLLGDGLAGRVRAALLRTATSAADVDGAYRYLTEVGVEVASEGKLTFDDPTYVTFRRVLDGGMHFCHRLRLLDILMFQVFTSYPEMRASAQAFEEEWVENAERHEPDARRQLRVIRDQFHNTVLELSLIHI